MTAPVSEADLQALIVDAARWGGWLHYHTHDSRRSAAGFPDLVLAHPERGVVFVEVKSERGRLTVEQERWRVALAAAGAEHWVARPAGIDALIARLAGGPVPP